MYLYREFHEMSWRKRCPGGRNGVRKSSIDIEKAIRMTLCMSIYQLFVRHIKVFAFWKTSNCLPMLPKTFG